MKSVAFIGLGTMGYPMAAHLARKGCNVTVYNRTTSKAGKWVGEHGGRQAATPAEAAHDADIVITCVGNDDDLRDVVLGGNGVAASLRSGAVLVDHSTVSAEIARELADRLTHWEASFIDAPVSGGQQGAQNGQLTIMCGGNAATFEEVQPVLACYAKAVTLMGPVGAGQLTKMVNQICVAGLVEALAEGMYFAEKAGLDVQTVIDAISQGAASSWQMINRHKTMICGEYNHGFAVDWMRKDLDICLKEAQRMGITLPVTAQVDQFYADVQAIGGGRWDTSSLLARLKQGQVRRKD
ncbi:MAG: 6-phosphogluconate dehydrogenase [Moraxellaceae bacterium]|jgi:3-hydroxyisobutyrate dehydrogenase|nr:6-phosphogluconate dehydrogenase [Moraxellaceae bacterium]